MAPAEAGARYDGHSDWYDETFSRFAASGREADFVRSSLGEGHGELCLDVACGTGLYGPPVAEQGYTSVGFDISADQIRIARLRLPIVGRADAARLPLRSETFAVAVGMFFHTDLEDFATVVREVGRCLRPGGRFVYVGVHPCFIGPFVHRTAEDVAGEVTFVPGYGRAGWAQGGSGGSVGLWSRVGGHHKSLSAFVEAFTTGPLILRSMREFSGGGTVIPRNLGVVAERP